VTVSDLDRHAAPGEHQGVDPIDAVLDLFRARGGRVTSSRRLLLRCLFEQDEHCTAEELVTAVNDVDPDVHRSTIYRNLDELEQLGVVEHVHLGHGPATYHLTTQRHGHLVCDVCGTALPIPDEFFADVAAAARRQYGFRLRPRHFALVGTCASCAGSD
jgi:Fe2+ or Zn2+ uptake regulation protein